MGGRRVQKDPRLSWLGQQRPGAINTDGVIVGSESNAEDIVDGKFHGFLLKDSAYSLTDYPGAFLTEPSGINDSGVVVGTYCLKKNCEDGVYNGFRYSDGAYTTINAPGVTQTFPGGINKAGVISGNYTGRKVTTWPGSWGRSMFDLFHTLQDLQSLEVSLVAQTGLQFDLRSAQGNLIASLMVALAEFERDLLRERVRSGIVAACKRGVVFGGGLGQRVTEDTMAPKVLKLVGEG